MLTVEINRQYQQSSIERQFHAIRTSCEPMYISTRVHYWMQRFIRDEGVSVVHMYVITVIEIFETPMQEGKPGKHQRDENGECTY